MSEIGDLYRELRSESKAKRARNRDLSLKLLRERGVTYTVKNGGAHIIVNGRIDFWPGTGLWIERGGARGRGVKDLLRHIGAW